MKVDTALVLRTPGFLFIRTEEQEFVISNDAFSHEKPSLVPLIQRNIGEVETVTLQLIKENSAAQCKKMQENFVQKFQSEIENLPDLTDSDEPVSPEKGSDEE